MDFLQMVKGAIVASVLLGTGAYANLIEDAHIGTTVGWTDINGTVENIADSDNNRAFKISGFCVYGKYWKHGNTLFQTNNALSLDIDVKASRVYTIYIYVKTDKGIKQIIAYPSLTPSIYKGYKDSVRYAMDRSSITGNWEHLSFDLQSLFDQVGIEVSVKGVDGIGIQATYAPVEIDNITISTEDIE